MGGTVRPGSELKAHLKGELRVRRAPRAHARAPCEETPPRRDARQAGGHESCHSERIFLWILRIFHVQFRGSHGPGLAYGCTFFGSVLKLEQLNNPSQRLLSF